MISWQDRTVEWDSLQRYAGQFQGFDSVVDWLYAIGIVPNDVLIMPEPNIKTEIDPKKIRCGYLAASAFQMERWGQLTPKEFLDIIELELAGSLKNSVATEAKDPNKPDSKAPSVTTTVALIDTPALDRFLLQALVELTDYDILEAPTGEYEIN